MSLIDVNVPNIGEFQDVEVIEVICKVGETVATEDPLISMESDKATMDVPSETLSPALTLISQISPATGEGTSIVDLSLSTEISGSSATTVSPTLHITSLT
jgi:hypothetical protein